ncbi:hypothetical protein HYH02_001423 [Chlamydomonas schloesseri]|uniref:Uncharacterized protein n=1 Tax=Chlamydomonas schloesseri TaxID=2026947 RepID=A0A836BD77_9CHLO|nr:hypothetical protein HYH02_001423 [Chlamydomonas schloesseri]|eukprot:KAG2454400.1 hypothetical protein HYH02_001423 [Chlamydomonas schloesseri]
MSSGKRRQLAEFRHGLEWRPCPPSHSGSTAGAGSGSSAASSPSSSRTLVVLLPWMWAASTSVDKHVELYHSLGCDVALYRWPALAVWLPPLAARNAVGLLRGLAAHLQTLAPGAETETETEAEAEAEAGQEQEQAEASAGEEAGSGQAWRSSNVWREAAGWRGVGAASCGPGAPSCSGADSQSRVGGGTGGGGGGGGGGGTPRPTHHRRVRRPHVVLVSYSGAAKGVLAPALERLVAAAESALRTEEATAAAAEAAVAGAAGGTSGAASSGGPSGGGGSCSSNRGAADAGPSQSERQPRPPSRPQPPGGPVGAAERAVLAHLAGVVFDSGPVDFDSSVGVTLFANSKVAAVRELQRAAGGAAAGAMDFFLYEAFEAQRRHMWRSLRTSLALLNAPTAFLFSWAGDGLADPQPIHALVTALRTPAPPPPWYGGQQQQQQPQQQLNMVGEGGAGGGGGAGQQQQEQQQQERTWGRWAWDMAWAAVLPMSPFGHGHMSAAAGAGAAGQAAGGDAAAAAAAALPTPSPLAGLDFSGGADATVASALGGEAGGSAAADGLGPPGTPLTQAAVAAGVQAGQRQRPLLLPAVDWVQEQGWAASAHVAHLRQHPEEYRAAVAALLQRSEQQ